MRLEEREKCRKDLDVVKKEVSDNFNIIKLLNILFTLLC